MLRRASVWDIENGRVARGQFYLAEYEARFHLSAEGLQQLQLISKISQERDVALICQCRDFERCHTDLLLLWAKHQFGAQISGVIFDYPVFQGRLNAGMTQALSKDPGDTTKILE